MIDHEQNSSISKISKLIMRVHVCVQCSSTRQIIYITALKSKNVIAPHLQDQSCINKLYVDETKKTKIKT